jgi:hypothetical protein
MRNKLWLGLAGGGVLLVGVVMGALISGGIPAWASGGSNASAAPAASGNYCQLYEQRVARDLGVSMANLESANQDALKAAVQHAYADRAITQAQETRLLNKVSQIGTHPCAALGRFGAFGHNGGKAPGRAQLAGAREAIVNAVAAKLNLPMAMLESDLAAGQTVSQIAAAQHVRLGDVNAAYLSSVQAQLKTAVSNGTITQAQSDMAYSTIQQAVANGKYPLLQGRGMHP